MKVAELIKELGKYPPDYEVMTHQQGGVFDLPIIKVEHMDYDKKWDRKQIIIHS